MFYKWCFPIGRSSPSEVFTGKGVLKKCSKFTGEHPCRNAISINLQSNFIQIALWHGCTFVNLLHIFRASFPKNTSEGLLLNWYVAITGNYQFWNVKDDSISFFLLTALSMLFFFAAIKYKKELIKYPYEHKKTSMNTRKHIVNNISYCVKDEIITSRIMSVEIHILIIFFQSII